MIPTTVEKGDEKDVSALEALPDASPNDITLMTKFPTVPTYNILENEVASIQESIWTSQPDSFDKIVSILMSVLECHQQATGLNKEINCHVDNFETQFNEKGFIHKVFKSLT